MNAGTPADRARRISFGQGQFGQQSNRLLGGRGQAAVAAGIETGVRLAAEGEQLPRRQARQRRRRGDGTQEAKQIATLQGEHSAEGRG